MIVAGLLVLFVLREDLYNFIITVLKLVGIFAGVVLVIVGVALVAGGTWMRRRPYGLGKIGT